MFLWQCYTSPLLALDLLRKGIYVCGALSTKRSGWPSHRVVPAKRPMGASRTMQLGRMTVVSQKDTSTGVATILSTAHNLNSTRLCRVGIARVASKSICTAMPTTRSMRIVTPVLMD